MKIKNLVWPGYVWSLDGDKHFITGTELIKLYGLKWEDTLIIRDAEQDLRGREHLLSDPEVKHYHPLQSGKYVKARRR